MQQCGECRVQRPAGSCYAGMEGEQLRAAGAPTATYGSAGRDNPAYQPGSGEQGGAGAVREDGPGEESRKEDKADLDTALAFCGHGRYHWWLAWVCGWANASDAVEILCISFLLPAAECELELTSRRYKTRCSTALLFMHHLYDSERPTCPPSCLPGCWWAATCGASSGTRTAGGGCS